jgi:hypothetical protein
MVARSGNLVAITAILDGSGRLRRRTPSSRALAKYAGALDVDDGVLPVLVVTTTSRDQRDHAGESLRSSVTTMVMAETC